MFSHLFKSEKNNKPPMTEDQIREALRDDLLSYACRYSETTGIKNLPEDGIPDLYVKFDEKQVAYLHGCSFNGDSRVKIIHFAVEKQYVSKGFGEALAYGFAAALRKAYSTQSIEFEERSYSPEHEKLFKKLGATPVDHPLFPNKPNWVWHC